MENKQRAMKMGIRANGNLGQHFQKQTSKWDPICSRAYCILLPHTFHAAPIKSARGSGTSHRNPQIRIERNRLGAKESEGTPPGIDFEKSQIGATDFKFEEGDGTGCNAS